MTYFANLVQRFLASEDGPTAAEYAVILALIVLVCVTVVEPVGTYAKSTFNAVQDALS